MTYLFHVSAFIFPFSKLEIVSKTPALLGQSHILRMLGFGLALWLRQPKCYKVVQWFLIVQFTAETGVPPCPSHRLDDETMWNVENGLYSFG